jgi:hypothetical protein
LIVPDRLKLIVADPLSSYRSSLGKFRFVKRRAWLY